MPETATQTDSFTVEPFDPNQHGHLIADHSCVCADHSSGATRPAQVNR